MWNLLPSHLCGLRTHSLLKIKTGILQALCWLHVSLQLAEGEHTDSERNVDRNPRCPWTESSWFMTPGSAELMIYDFEKPELRWTTPSATRAMFYFYILIWNSYYSVNKNVQMRCSSFSTSLCALLGSTCQPRSLREEGRGGMTYSWYNFSWVTGHWGWNFQPNTTLLDGDMNEQRQENWRYTIL